MADIFDEIPEGRDPATSLEKAEKNRRALGGKPLSKEEQEIQDYKLNTVKELSTPIYETLANAWDVDALLNAYGPDAAGMVSALGLSLTPKKASKSAAMAEAMESQLERARKDELLGLSKNVDARGAEKQKISKAQAQVQALRDIRKERERATKYEKAAASTLSLLEKSVAGYDKEDAKVGLSPKQKARRDTDAQKLEHGRSFLLDGVKTKQDYNQFKAEMKSYETRKLKEGEPTYGR